VGKNSIARDLFSSSFHNPGFKYGRFCPVIRIFQSTSSATSWGSMWTAFIQPYLLIIPLAGVLVDRHNRKLMMISK